MKIILFSLLCLILIGTTSYSYAVWIKLRDNPDKNIELPKVMLQLELRDSNGILISYAEGEQILGIAPFELNRYLDKIQKKTGKEFFMKNDIKYESQQWESRSSPYTDKLAFSTTRLLETYQNEFLPVLDIRHDSFQTQPGDTLRIFWTIIRPAS